MSLQPGEAAGEGGRGPGRAGRGPEGGRAGAARAGAGRGAGGGWRGHGRGRGLRRVFGAWRVDGRVLVAALWRPDLGLVCGEASLVHSRYSCLDFLARALGRGAGVDICLPYTGACVYRARRCTAPSSESGVAEGIVSVAPHGGVGVSREARSSSGGGDAPPAMLWLRGPAHTRHHDRPLPADYNAGPVVLEQCQQPHRAA